MLFVAAVHVFSTTAFMGSDNFHVHGFAIRSLVVNPVRGRSDGVGSGVFGVGVGRSSVDKGLAMTIEDAEGEYDEEEEEEEEADFLTIGGEKDFDGSHPDTPSVVLEDLSWRVEKLRLEESNTKRFLKARPAFLPYEECRKWVAAWNRWESKEEWREWIDMGEKRNSYIPARPDEYYGRLGKWISWSHFLGLED